jgi:hypothetical protein
MNHSCAPTVKICVETMTVVALVDLDVGDEVTFSTRGILVPTQYRVGNEPTVSLLVRFVALPSPDRNQS